MIRVTAAVPAAVARLARPPFGVDVSALLPGTPAIARLRAQWPFFPVLPPARVLPREWSEVGFDPAGPSR
jgi:hypothetical protein